MINILVFLLAIAGLLVSWYISYKKEKNEHMVCIIGKKCEEVIYSKYNNLFGTPLENLGMLYYAVVAVLVVVFLLGVTGLGPLSVFSVLITLAIIGVLFSAYLTYIQFFVLRAACDYCLASALISLLILIVEIL